jgi:hypothetical protein
MKRLVLSLGISLIALSTPVIANASNDSPFYYDENGLIQVKPGTPHFTGGTKIEYPLDPFTDDAPNSEELVAPKDAAENPGDNPHLDPNNVIETDDNTAVDSQDPEETAADEEESEYYHVPTYVDREYIVVAVNPKMHRYMARSIEPTVVKMKKNVIFTQDYSISEKPLKRGDKVVLTFDEDESDGIDSDRVDGLVYVTPEWLLDGIQDGELSDN